MTPYLLQRALNHGRLFLKGVYNAVEMVSKGFRMTSPYWGTVGSTLDRGL